MSAHHLYPRRLLGALVVLTMLLPGLAACGKSGPISKSEVNTGIQVHAGDTVHITSTGLVDFGGAIAGFGAPKLNADGDDQPTPTDYPAPALRKNSLICKVGSIWYQGGVDKQFTPTEDGVVVLRPNDSNLADNSRGWNYKIDITPGDANGSRQYGPLPVSNLQFDTRIAVKALSTVRISSTGILDLGGAVVGAGAPKLDANGDDQPTPGDYPAPNLLKNSLICMVGSLWYQGGVDATFVPSEDGTLIIRPNDADLADNSRGWSVSIAVTPPAASGGQYAVGPIPVSSQQVETRIPVKGFSTVHVHSTGILDLGGAVAGLGAPKLDANGDDQPTPGNYPAPNLRKNSLICLVGSLWYQGGVDAVFVPAEDGTLIIRPNDPDLTDNSRGWSVTITVSPPPSTGTGTPGQSYSVGPIPVSNSQVDTSIPVKARSTVHITSTGIVDFGGAVAGVGAPKLDANGDDQPTPGNYPAPNLRKNSLICKVGSLWYQGGVNTIFAPTEDGTLTIRPNDADLGDNSRGWSVSITVTPATALPPQGPQTYPFGPVPISNQEIDTHMQVAAQSTIHITSAGIVDFGGAVLGVGAPKLDANGDDSKTPGNYPAPNLRKNSLICRVGSIWYQGGTDQTFVVAQAGTLVIRPNDANLADNSRGWQVSGTIRTP